MQCDWPNALCIRVYLSKCCTYNQCIWPNAARLVQLNNVQSIYHIITLDHSIQPDRRKHATAHNCTVVSSQSLCHCTMVNCHYLLPISWDGRVSDIFKLISTSVLGARLDTADVMAYISKTLPRQWTQLALVTDNSRIRKSRFLFDFFQRLGSSRLSVLNTCSLATDVGGALR